MGRKRPRLRGEGRSSRSLTTIKTSSPSLFWFECRDVLQRIFFKFLGLSDVLQCRLVCKFWHLSAGDVDHIRRRLCCFAHHPVDDVFWLRPEVDSVHVCPRPTTSSTTCWKSTLRLALPRYYQRCVVAASAHGLLCLQLDNGEYDKSTPSLAVCNPVAGTHKVLPKFNCITSIESIGMHFNLLAKSYTILVTGTSGNSSKAYLHDNGDLVKEPFYVSHVEIYHSQAGSWEHHSHFITDNGVRKGKIEWWQGQYHWIVKKQSSMTQFLAYDMTRKQWVDSNVPNLGVYDIPNLFVWKDTLLCKSRKSFNQPKHWKLECSATTQATTFPSSDKMAWQPLHFDNGENPSTSMEKATSLHIATHFSNHGLLQVCIFDPFLFAPSESPVTSSQSNIIHAKRHFKDACFSFIPCHSNEV